MVTIQEEKINFTILTDPMPIGNFFFVEFTKHILRSIKYFFFSRPIGSHPYYRGHVGVTRSLIEGLKKNKYEFYNYNPKDETLLHPTVLVLSGVSTLKQAILLKQKGRIKKLIAGPNIIVFSSDFNNIIASDEIDCVITPSEIINDLYILDNKNLKTKIVAWPAGVDIDFWKPLINQNRVQILIYEKQIKGPVGPIDPYVDFLKKLNYHVQIIKYGNYSISEYRMQLQKSLLMIGFVTDESQGLAWAEAWASDVPTFIWKNDTNIFAGRRYSCCTAPYLTNDNGIYFNDFEDFKTKFYQWENNVFDFKARQWCLENMSDEVCADKIVKIINKC